MKRFKSARSAALALAVPISTYGAHERAESPGGRDYGPDEARRYARHFGVTPEWLLIGPPDPTSGRPANEPLGKLAPKVRIVGYVGIGAQVHLYSILPENLEEIAVSVLAADLWSDGSWQWHRTLFQPLADTVQRPAPARDSDLLGHLCVVALRTVVLSLSGRSADQESSS
jgi:hypothetical protein